MEVLIDSVSFSELLNTLPRLVTGFSIRLGMEVPPTVNQHQSTTLPPLSTRDLDFLVLKFILAHAMNCSSPHRLYLHPGDNLAVTVMSSMNALMGGCWIPDLVIGPLHSTSAGISNSNFIHNAFLKEKILMMT